MERDLQCDKHGRGRIWTDLKGNSVKAVQSTCSNYDGGPEAGQSRRKQGKCMYLFSHKNLQYCICKAKIAKNSMVLVQFRPDPMTLSLSLSRESLK